MLVSTKSPDINIHFWEFDINLKVFLGTKLALSRLLLKITDYLSLLPTFPGSDNCTQGVPVPWYGWKAYELFWSREF